MRFTIMHDMFRSFRLILNNGSNVLSSGGDAAMPSHQNIENIHYRLFMDLSKILPDLQARIRDGPDAMQLLSEHLTTGRQAIIQQATHGVKIAIPDWLKNQQPALDKYDKAKRGFRNEECGRLLCPANYDFNKPEVREALLNYDGKRYPVTAEQYPVFMWKDEKLQDKIWEGFGRHELLIKAGTMVLQGPKAALNVTTTGSNPIPAVSHSINTKARSRRWHLKTITPAFIACAAVLVRFALSDETSFPAQPLNESIDEHRVAEVPKRRHRARHWDYTKFHQYLVHSIEEDMPEEEREDLLIWWKSRILGSSGGYTSDESIAGESSDGSNDQDGPSVMSLLAAEGRQASICM
ncbi:hypothetical protein BDY19DRAFT_939705 [Irpex rosettiformis]|uniref:Uncharacterized protein n=1 Tax=Irpex rosettiformis TaxID=378272 RepID=A0ACB8U8P8_9APHY|nr:hypothetical protein BDY19DRAFT_939705 [Irpex rosettiformis]